MDANYTHPSSKQPQLAERLTVILLLGLQLTLLMYSATRHSPTLAEPAFLASGISHWETGEFSLYRVNPPLVRMIAAIPVMLVGYQADWSRVIDAPGYRSEFMVATDFLHCNQARSIELIIFARFICIPISLIGSYFAYRWSRELYGRGSGLTTLILFVTEPNLLAHEELITPDSTCISLGIMASYAFWKWLQSPSWTKTLITGLALGTAELTKFSWIILFAIWPTIWVIRRFFPKSDRPRQPNDTPIPQQTPPLLQLSAILTIAIYTINAGYGFNNSCHELGSFEFISHSLGGKTDDFQPSNRFTDTLTSRIPIPLPAQYVLGIDAQKKDFETFASRSYLRGAWQNHGWWYYYIYGLLVKTPCPIWALLAATVITRAFSHTQFDWRDEICVLLPAASLLLLVSSQDCFSIHLRYSYPILGFLLIFLGQSFAVLTKRSPRIIMRHAKRYRSATRKIFPNKAEPQTSFPSGLVMLATLLTYSVVSLLSVYPHQLSYFNDFVGGPRNGYRHLLGSSFDWGQDWLLFAEQRDQLLASSEACNVTTQTNQQVPFLVLESSNAGQQNINGLYSASDISFLLQNNLTPLVDSNLQSLRRTGYTIFWEKLPPEESVTR